MSPGNISESVWLPSGVAPFAANDRGNGESVQNNNAVDMTIAIGSLLFFLFFGFIMPLLFIYLGYPFSGTPSGARALLSLPR
jgi:hypothetical protein